MRRQIIGSVRAGERTTRVAERLLDVGNPIVRLPRHVRDLESAARQALASGDRNVYKLAVKKWAGTIDRLGSVAGQEFSIRSATQQLVKDLDKAKVDQIDKVVERWTLERARHQARVIARSETVGGYQNQYQNQTSAQPYTVGYRWVLSPRHPKADVCDTLASQDLDGLGPGGYLPESVPSAPHPNDLCSTVAIIDTGHFKRARAKRKGTPEPPKPWLSGKTENGEAWLKKQPAAFQRDLLGPSRFDAFKRGQQVLDKSGRPIPVHKVLGTPKPVRKLGPAVLVKPTIKADRASFVQPFPPVAPSKR